MTQRSEAVVQVLMRLTYAQTALALRAATPVQVVLSAQDAATLSLLKSIGRLPVVTFGGPVSFILGTYANGMPEAEVFAP